MYIYVVADNVCNICYKVIVFLVLLSLQHLQTNNTNYPHIINNLYISYPHGKNTYNSL